MKKTQPTADGFEDGGREEAMSQGMWAVSKCWKRQGSGLSQKLQKQCSPAKP